MSHKNPEFKFKYIFSNDYNPVYVNGAHGGVTPRGELVVNFYQERLPLPDAITHELNPNGTIGKEVAVEPGDLNKSLVRFLSNGVVLTYQTARDLHHWLGEKIKEMETMEKARVAHQPGQPPEGKGFSH